MRLVLCALTVMVLLASPAVAQDKGKIAVTTDEASTVVSGGVYMLKNDGTATVSWECNNTTVSTANSSVLNSGQAVRVPPGCKRIAYKTSTGTAALRYYVTEEMATGMGSSINTGNSTGLICTECVGSSDMTDDDFTDFTCLNGACTLDADVVAAAEMADADHGAVSWSSGVATVEDLACTGCASATDLAAASVAESEVGDAVCVHVFTSTAADPTEAGATNDYLSLLDGAGSTNEASEDDYVMFAAQAMTVNNLRCVAATAPGAGKDPWTMTVRVGVAGSLADTDVTCAIDEAETSCTDATNDAAVAPGDSITISISSAGGAADPDANALITCSMCLGT